VSWLYWPGDDGRAAVFLGADLRANDGLIPRLWLRTRYF